MSDRTRAAPRGLALEQLVLTLTDRCNQRCDYCYVPRGGTRTMSLDVACRALDLFYAHARPAGKLSVAFFGGEPFLEPALLRRVAEEALRRAGGRAVELSATTNATALDDEGLAVVRDLGLRLAVSLDGAGGHAARRLADGAPSLPLALRNLRRLQALPGAVAVARMTVTPASVTTFAADVRSVLETGVPSIQYLPAFEADWSDDAVARWTREHHHLVTWLVGRRGAGAPCPSLPAWRGILGRLAGRPRRHCGAGTRRLAVSLEGELHPCYRTVFGAEGRRLALGDVWSGITRPDLQAALAGLDPARVRPEAGACADCAAREGCGFFCPALGLLLADDPAVVPRAACALVRGQVEACARLAVRPARSGRRPLRTAWAAALAAAFIGTAAPACTRSVGAAHDAATSDAGVDDDADLPGVCTTWLDGGPDAGVDASIIPGLCPVGFDAGADASPDAGCDPGYGGIC